MTYEDYQVMKQGKNESAGMFGSEIYAYEKLSSSKRASVYIQIMKAEFDTFGNWGAAKRFEINRRPYLCAVDGEHEEIQEYDIEVHCPICQTDFLLSRYKPDHIPIESCCPECRHYTDRKLDLVHELEQQLKKAGLEDSNLLFGIRFYYLEPYGPVDMVGYVMIDPDYYYLKVSERGRPVIEYRVTDRQEAVYWILIQLVEFEVRQRLKKTDGFQEHEYTDFWQQRLNAEVRGYFDKMDSVYQKWFVVGRNIFNFDNTDNK